LIPAGDCVVDASVALKWVLEEEGSTEAAMLLDGRPLYAPSLFEVEIANALWVAARRGKVTKGEADLLLDTLLGAGVRRIEPTVDLIFSAMTLAGDLDHPVYDCLYLGAALMLGVPVVTADKRFRSAADKAAGMAGVVMLLGQDV
jgi:predicted nucleic acid-binding protein